MQYIVIWTEQKQRIPNTTSCYDTRCTTYSDFLSFFLFLNTKTAWQFFLSILFNRPVRYDLQIWSAVHFFNTDINRLSIYSVKLLKNINRTSILDLRRLFTSAQVFFLWQIMIKCFFWMNGGTSVRFFISSKRPGLCIDRPVQVARETI